MRSFVAVEIPAPVKQRLGCLLDRLKAQAPRRSVRWVRETQLHLTLRFVGQIDRDRGVDLVAAVRRAVAGDEAFDVSLGGLGAFPGAQRPRVVWLGVDPDGGRRLGDLARALDSEIISAGLAEPERRGFSPHLTLGRSRAPRGDGRLSGLLDQPAGDHPLDMRVAGVTVFESVLGSAGAVHSRLEQVSFAGEP